MPYSTAINTLKTFRLSLVLLGFITLVACGDVEDVALPINEAPTASRVTITDDNAGDSVVGDSLTGNYIYADAENDAEGVSIYRWLRNGEFIGGATTSSYILVAADIGLSITFEVTPVAATGTITGITAISNVITVFNSAPTASGISITDNNGGSLVVGDKLTGSYTYADVEGDAEGTSTFRWLRNGIAISGATNLSYTLVAEDSETNIVFEVTPVAATGTAIGNAVTSSGLLVINSAPMALGVSITDDNGGIAVVGDSLTGNYIYADVDADVEGTSLFRWLRDGVAISSATKATYTLVAADSLAASITFEVTPIAATGTVLGSTVTSTGVTVNNSAPIASSVTITDDNGGSVLVGDNLTGDYSYSDVDGDAQGTSTFRWLRNGTAISGATALTYTLVIDDSGQTIRFEVTPVAATGTNTGTAVVSAGITVANSAPTASSVIITDDNGGSALVGDNLTGEYSYSDVDGDAQGTSTFRWLRNGTAISGATALTYTLVIDDSGKTIWFEVTPVAATGTTTGIAAISGVITVANSPPTASSVTITDDNGGSALVGDTLTGSYSYADVDGDLEGTSTYQWLRDNVAIVSQTNLTYTLVTADSAASITFEVIPVAVTGIITGIVVSSSDIIVANSAPVADAGVDQAALFGDTVILDGSASSDVDGDGLTYSWSFISRPPLSAATLTGPTTVNPSFDINVSGEYVVQLIVNDGTENSAPDTVTISTNNTAPVANAGADQTPLVNDTVTLDGTASSDVDGDLLTYRWSLTAPPGSGATLSDTAAISPTFGVDLPGDYVAQLTVNDGTVDSAADTVTISTINSAPVADAGVDQAALFGDTVTLNGSASSDVDGDPLTYRWSFTSVPVGSATTLSDPAAVNPSFNIDVSGNYVVQLIVNDGTVDSTADTVTISTTNSAPVADAGADQTTLLGDTVILNGSASSDVDGDPLIYRWSFTSVPPGSGATLSGTAIVNPSFVVDMSGSYVIQLIVNDGTVDSTADTVTISTTNSAPVADAGADQAAVFGDIVILNGSASSDVDGDPLTYRWSFTSVPVGSATTLSDPEVVNPSFDIDVSGDYVVQLIVNDGTVDSAPNTVTISTSNSAPVADAGTDQTPLVGDTVILNGSASSDVDGDPLTYSWSLTVPVGSGAALSDTAVVNPSFDIDVSGDYVVQLIVNDGTVDSAPNTVTISTSNSAPVADAGTDQTPLVGETVTLNGSGSSDVDGDSLTYSWSLTAPAGSGATLSDTAAISPTFAVDLPGDYVAQLIVNDGKVDSVPDTVTISTSNSAPVADAGADQTPLVGETVTLNGSGSSDVDGDPLTYSWSLTAPVGSGAALSDTAAISPTFTVDLPGDYVAQLIVNDGTVDSVPDTVTISTSNSAPVADAGADQTPLVGETVTLNGSGSSDVDGDSLTYSWSLTVPLGSGATLSDIAAISPTFVVDLPGDYVAQLIVNDGTVDSIPDTVTISTSNSAPVADAGPDQTVLVTDIVTLDGISSSDVDGDSLTYSWSLTVPLGSGATLSDTAAISPTFVVDLPGDYVAQLIVNDGTVDSAPDTVTISTSNSVPVADAGADQSAVLLGATVTLDGSGSNDVDGDDLTYSWSFTSKPALSAAVLSDPTALSPSFVFDVSGEYVVQLIVSDGTVDSTPDTVSISP